MSASLRLYKCEKLRSLTAIEQLFASGGKCHGRMAYPWRAVWRFRQSDDRRGSIPQFVITVPKRRLRHAVDRVRMRRVMREAYRLNRHLFPENGNCPVDIAFIYVADDLTTYKAAVKSVTRIISAIAAEWAGLNS
ncbi:MAG: ribonuclease P protein component [Paramuribaculum sp.]|nr:ribonuclease P protein component [Paramuribaculum sp.]MDE6323180.1 ribonuclease P protein component [Paramuribaculum sp.]MDE6489133.1 ribonuclease P protein component [Paramuribaculum sp.]